MAGSRIRGKSLRSPAAQILETALALQRAPGERFRLRERPLPPGVIHLIEVAAGSPPVLQAAAAELGETERGLLEAARFYLEQVLFADPDADAYRVLGLAHDVPHETIRTHHRWLQRWLHPDRALAGDASVFATRVNQAFAQLRSPESRHAYDVRLAEARLAGASAPLAPGTVRRWEHAEVEAPRHGRRSRWLLAAALVSCIVLAVLIARNPENAAPWQPGENADDQVATEVHDAPAIEDRDLGILSDALASASPDAASTMPASEASPMLAPDIPVAAAAVPAVPAPIPPARIATPSIAAFKPRAIASTHGWHSVVSSVATVPDAAADPAKAAEPAASRPATVAATDAMVAAAAHEPAAGVVEPDAEPLPAKVVTAPPPPEASVQAADGAVVLARMRMAEERVAEVTAYLASRPGASPAWNDPKVQADAERFRQILDARKGSRLDLGRPSWRLSSERASVTADYRCRSASRSPCEGRLDVGLVWREGMWLVRTVALGPAA